MIEKEGGVAEPVVVVEDFKAVTVPVPETRPRLQVSKRTTWLCPWESPIWQEALCTCGLAFIYNVRHVCWQDVFSKYQYKRPPNHPSSRHVNEPVSSSMPLVPPAFTLPTVHHHHHHHHHHHSPLAPAFKIDRRPLQA